MPNTYIHTYRVKHKIYIKMVKYIYKNKNLITKKLRPINSSTYACAVWNMSSRDANLWYLKFNRVESCNSNLARNFNKKRKKIVQKIKINCIIWLVSDTKWIAFSLYDSLKQHPRRLCSLLFLVDHSFGSPSFGPACCILQAFDGWVSAHFIANAISVYIDDCAILLIHEILKVQACF